MERKIVTYKRMLKASKTLDEYGELNIGEDFTLKFREKLFTVLNSEGYEYERGPCLSIQLFHLNHFLKAISLPWEYMPKLSGIIQQIINIKSKVG